MNILTFSLVKEGKTNLFQMKDLITPNHTVTLNVMQGEVLVLSSSVVFARVEEDFEREDLAVITNTTTNQIYLSKKAMEKYILVKIIKTTNGYDHHYIFQYQL